MEPPPAVPRHEAIERGEPSVHEWRAIQLIRLGIPRPWPRRTPPAGMPPTCSRLSSASRAR